MSTANLLTIGEISRRSGFAPSALRYYDGLGLIEAQRTPGGRRVFERNTLRRLAFIRAASNVGLTIDEISAELALLPAGRNPTKADWARISADWRSRLDEQITALQTLRNGLESCIGCGCLSLKACAFSNPDDVLQHKGTGARLLPKALRTSQASAASQPSSPLRDRLEPAAPTSRPRQ